MENLYTIEEIFSDRIFRVPDYQRGFAWEEQQCRDFVEDLELIGEGGEHFLGLLILRRDARDTGQVRSETGKRYTTYDVVDGQQRLTTIVLFIDAIRRQMEPFDRLQKLGTGLDERFLAIRDKLGQTRLKLQLNRDTHGFFKGAILQKSDDIPVPTIRSHRLLLKARDTYRTYLERKREETDDYADWLENLYYKIAGQLAVVIYTVESEADAGVVFETMNNRGKPLTELEKVKNYLLYLVSKLELPEPHGLEAEVNKTWTHIFEHLMAAERSSVFNEDRLLRAHWLMAHDHDRRNWRGSRSIKDRFSLRAYQGRHLSLLGDLTAYLTGLRNATVAYCDIFNPSHPSAFTALTSDDSLRRELVSAGGRLARVGSLATFLPLLMAMWIKAPDDGGLYLEALELCERFAFRTYRWLGRRSNTGQSRLFRLGYQLFKGRDPQDALAALRDAVLTYCSNERFAARFRLEGENWFGWWGLKYFLYEYEQHLADERGKKVKMPWDELTRKKDSIEHILPQTPDRGGYWAARFTPEEHERYVHDIGNLTLTFDNSALGNKPFREKKGSPGELGCYAGSQILMEQALARHDDWTRVHIEERRKEIEAWAIERWHVEPPLSEPVEWEVNPDGVGEDQTPLVEMIKRVITRRFIAYGQMALYQALHASPEGLSKTELADQIRGGDTRSLTGVLGALGNRINATEPFKARRPGIGLFVEISRRGNEWHYRMRRELRAAIEELPGLKAVLGWPLEEIYERYQEAWWPNRASQRRELTL